MTGSPPDTPAVGLTVSDLSVGYGGTPALQDVSLELAPGAITAIIGPSGCGKSSLLAALNQLTDMTPDCRISGSIRVGGHDIHAPGTDLVALRRRVGMIFQQPNPFPLSIRRNLEIPLRELGLGRNERRRRVSDALDRVGLWAEVRHRLDAPALALSGGQQQRLCIARAIALEPEVLLFDEPCSALDPIAAETVERLVAALRGRYTVAIVTHNLAQARRIADYTALFWWRDGAGRLIESGPTERLFTAPRDPLTAAYVEGRRG